MAEPIGLGRHAAAAGENDLAGRRGLVTFTLAAAAFAWLASRLG